MTHGRVWFVSIRHQEVDDLPRLKLWRCGTGPPPLSGPAMSSESAPLTGTPPPTLRAEFGATLALAWPLAAANLLQMMVHAIDVIFVARLGDTSLAAASLGIAIFGLLLWTGTGLVGAARSEEHPSELQ